MPPDPGWPEPPGNVLCPGLRPPSLPPSRISRPPGQVGPSSLISVLCKEPLEALDPDKLWLVALQVGVRLPRGSPHFSSVRFRGTPPTSLTPRSPEEAALAPVLPPPGRGPLSSLLGRCTFALTATGEWLSCDHLRQERRVRQGGALPRAGPGAPPLLVDMASPATVCRWRAYRRLTQPHWLPLINELSEKVEFPAGGNARATSAPFLAGPAVCDLRGLPQRLL